MALAFKIGDEKIHSFTVTKADLARFNDGLVHPVCSTFAITREAEYACRLFVLGLKTDEEEGIGTFVHVNHISPAMEGQEVEIVAKLKALARNVVVCSFKATVNGRLIADGETSQKIMKKTHLADHFARYTSE